MDYFEITLDRAVLSAIKSVATARASKNKIYRLDAICIRKSGIYASDGRILLKYDTSDRIAVGRIHEDDEFIITGVQVRAFLKQREMVRLRFYRGRDYYEWITPQGQDVEFPLLSNQYPNVECVRLDPLTDNAKARKDDKEQPWSCVKLSAKDLKRIVAAMDATKCEGVILSVRDHEYGVVFESTNPIKKFHAQAVPVGMKEHERKAYIGEEK